MGNRSHRRRFPKDSPMRTERRILGISSTDLAAESRIPLVRLCRAERGEITLDAAEEAARQLAIRFLQRPVREGEIEELLWSVPDDEAGIADFVRSLIDRARLGRPGDTLAAIREIAVLSPESRDRLVSILKAWEVVTP
jgi:hypothetical protein